MKINARVLLDMLYQLYSARTNDKVFRFAFESMNPERCVTIIFKKDEKTGGWDLVKIYENEPKFYNNGEDSMDTEIFDKDPETNGS